MAPELRDYQKFAVEYVRARKRAGLFLDMGLGKTAISLTALSGDMLPALVVAPKRVAEETWPEERDLWRPDLSLALAAGRPSDRIRALQSRADIVAIGRDNLADVRHADRRFKTVILDELSSFKSRGSQRWKIARQITAKADYVWGLTGSPTPNGLLDLWAQVYLLDNGARLGKTITAYRSRFFYPGRQLPSGVITEWVLRPGAQEKIFSLIEDLCLSIDTDGRVDLPEIIENEISVPLPPTVMKLYKQFKKKLLVDMDVLGGEVHTASSAAILTSKLSQITAGFLYVDEAALRNGQYDVIHTEKTKTAREIVEETGSPVLFFYRFRTELEALQKEFGKLAHTTQERGFQRRWNEGEIPILLAHPASAGHGLNLQKGPGHTLAWTTLPWSLEEWKQANRRLARPGQQHPVMQHTMISPRTIDPVIKSRLAEKEFVERALLDHLESPL